MFYDGQAFLQTSTFWHFDRFLERQCFSKQKFVWRYIDDVCSLWARDPVTFVSVADSCHSSLKCYLAEAREDFVGGGGSKE